MTYFRILLLFFPDFSPALSKIGFSQERANPDYKHNCVRFYVCIILLYSALIYIHEYTLYKNSIIIIIIITVIDFFNEH